MKTLRYIKARLGERSTYLLLVGAIVTASALAMPWSVISVIVGAIAALVPDGSVKPE